MAKNLSDILEREELIQKLRDAGFEQLVDAFLLNENKCFTKSNRTNKSGACRVLDWKPKQLEDAFAACAEILKDSI